MPDERSYPYDVFVSHASEDRGWVTGVLLPYLEAAGLTAFVGFRDFEVGRPLLDNLERAVDQARRTLLVISPAWLESGWTDLEGLLFQATDPSGRRQRTIPLILKPCRLPRRLELFTPADLTSDTEADRDRELARVVRALAARARLFFAYVPSVDQDRELKYRLSAALANSGHLGRSAAGGLLGLTRAEAVRDLLAQSDVMIALFSKASMADPQFLADVAAAADYPQLRVIPVRVDYLDPLPEQVRDLNDATWRSSDDDERLIRRLLDAVARGEHDAPARKPGGRVMLTSARSGGSLRSKLWTPGVAITVGFLEGDPALQWRVAQAATLWSQHANVRFVFTDPARAAIRIKFQAGEGTWSCLAMDALNVPFDQPTMNFDGLGADTDERELRATVLHAFGRVLGLIDEHLLPDAQIEWDRERVFAAVAHEYGWSKWDAEVALLDRFTENVYPVAKTFDPTSIMARAIPGTWTKNGVGIGPNLELSDGDKAFVARLYPRHLDRV